MKTKKTIFILAAFMFTAALPALAQDDDEDEKKMIREVVEVQVDRPVTPVAPVVEDPSAHGKKKKKKHEDPPPEVAPVDSGGTIPAPIEELKKRGNAWMVKKNKDFKKLDPTGSGNTLECTVTYVYQTKELNPTAPVDGKITMRVIIDCKEGKYRYTVRDIKHVADNAEFSGGDIYADFPACGSMSLPDPQWKKIKSFGVSKAASVAANLKEFMKNPVQTTKKDDW